MSLHGDNHGSGYGSDPPKVSTALCTPFPAPIHLVDDIIKQGYADSFQRQLISALRSRGLMDSIEEALPELEDILEANKDVSASDAQNFLDSLESTQQANMARVADLMSVTVLWTSLLQAEKDRLNAMIKSGDGAGVYEWLTAAVEMLVPLVPFVMLVAMNVM